VRQNQKYVTQTLLKHWYYTCYWPHL